MKKRWINTILIIAIFVMAIGGGTLAWFTATEETITNEFTAGTVVISADKVFQAGYIVPENWNPGDTTDLDIEVSNDGTKSIFLRAFVNMNWVQNQYRLFVVYTGRDIQLLAMEWSDDIHTDANGLVATGSMTVNQTGSSAYLQGTFSKLSNEDTLTNGQQYGLWCIDSNTTIYTNTNYPNVKIYDPIANPNWYDEIGNANIQNYWKNIPIRKIGYILAQGYLGKGYSVDNIQDAIWHYTNGKAVSGKAAEIVAEVDANAIELTTNNIEFELGDDWVKGNDGYYYYKYEILGTYRTNGDVQKIMFDAKVKLLGSQTGNEYQGQSLIVSVSFESIQSSNGAADSAWPGHPEFIRVSIPA